MNGNRVEDSKICKRNNRFSLGGREEGRKKAEKLKLNRERYLCASGEFGKLRAFLLAPPLLPLFPILHQF